MRWLRRWIRWPLPLGLASLATGLFVACAGGAPPPAAAPPAAPAPVALAPPIAPPPQNEYRIGPADLLQISVYNQSELATVQAVRPDGRIAFPLVGEVRAAGLTPAELSHALGQGLTRYVRDPQVTVVVTGFASKRVSVLGEVESPGVLDLVGDLDLAQAIAQAGGFTEKADLEGAMLVRGGEIQPVSFRKLFRQGDFTQNVRLAAGDILVVPNASERKVLVLGEVRSPAVITLAEDVTLLEAITRANGFTLDAYVSNVLLIRGGLNDPQVSIVDAKGILSGDAATNVVLAPRDIVYVPRSPISNALDFFVALRTVLQPFVLGETGVVLWQAIDSGRDTTVAVPGG